MNGLETRNVLENAVRAGLVTVADWLSCCAHRKITLPITIRATVNADGRPRTQLETYAVCLDCGRHLAYDGITMRLNKRRLPWNWKGVSHAWALAFLLTAAIACYAKAQPPEPFHISVNVNLVVLNATVRDRSGHFVSDLRQQDFEVYEDGIRQSIRVFRHDDMPVTVGLVVDHSGSMHRNLAQVIAAARMFVQSSSLRDEMFVVNFNESVSLGLPSALRFTDRPDLLALAISSRPAIGQTALYDAVVQALQALQAGSREKKALIVFSDGGDNASVHSLAQVIRQAEESNALVYTIGILDAEDRDWNPSVLRSLARASGGEAFFPRQLDEVVAICDRIAHDIRNQYTLGYVPISAAQPGAYHKIRMSARQAGSGKLSVRARSGYAEAAK